MTVFNRIANLGGGSLQDLNPEQPQRSVRRVSNAFFYLHRPMDRLDTEI